jgi:hypothetical protein
MNKSEYKIWRYYLFGSEYYKNVDFVTPLHFIYTFVIL